MAMVRPAGAVFIEGAAKFGHRHKNHIPRFVAQIREKGRNVLAVIFQGIAEISLDGPFFIMIVPAAHIQETDFDSGAGLDELGQVGKTVAEVALAVIGGSQGVGGVFQQTFHQLYRFAGLRARVGEQGIRISPIKAGDGVGLLGAHREIIAARAGHGRNGIVAPQDSGKTGRQGDRG